MIICSSCGEPVSEKGKFCAQCGAVLRGESSKIDGTLLDTDDPPKTPPEFSGATPNSIGECKFTILDEIARGGMAVVYRGRDERLRREVAIKYLLPEYATQKKAVDRMFVEARAIAQLQHPGIVSIYDIGEDERGPYIAMEYVIGPQGKPCTLEETVKQKGLYSPEDAVVLVAQLSSAVAAAHEKGIIHRDIKPSNVLLTASGEPKLTDFGIAHAVANEEEEGTQGLTLEGARLGTPDYMAPEQDGNAADVTEKTDVYGLGGLLYFSLTGFSSRHFHESKLPMELRSIVAKALEPDPAKRWESVEEFGSALSTGHTIFDELKSQVVNVASQQIEKLKSRWRGPIAPNASPDPTPNSGTLVEEGENATSETTQKTEDSTRRPNTGVASEIPVFTGFIFTVAALLISFFSAPWRTVPVGLAVVLAVFVIWGSFFSQLNAVDFVKNLRKKISSFGDYIKESALSQVALAIPLLVSVLCFPLVVFVATATFIFLVQLEREGILPVLLESCERHAKKSGKLVYGMILGFSHSRGSLVLVALLLAGSIAYVAYHFTLWFNAKSLLPDDWIEYYEDYKAPVIIVLGLSIIPIFSMLAAVCGKSKIAAKETSPDNRTSKERTVAVAEKKSAMKEGVKKFDFPAHFAQRQALSLLGMSTLIVFLISSSTRHSDFPGWVGLVVAFVVALGINVIVRRIMPKHDPPMKATSFLSVMACLVAIGNLASLVIVHSSLLSVIQVLLLGFLLSFAFRMFAGTTDDDKHFVLFLTAWGYCLLGSLVLRSRFITIGEWKWWGLLFLVWYGYALASGRLQRLRCFMEKLQERAKEVRESIHEEEPVDGDENFDQGRE